CGGGGDGRRVQWRGNHGEPCGRLFRNPAVRIRIGARELGDLRPGSLAVPIQGESLAVLEQDRYGRIGKEVAQTVAGFELQFVSGEQRVSLNKDVRHGVLVVAESPRRELARHDAASEPGIALEDGDLPTRY